MEIKVGLIGAGFIGRSHGLALSAVNRVFTDAPLAHAQIIAEADEDLARSRAAQLGFREWTTDWREVIDKSDAVVIAVPSFLHAEIATEAAKQRTHILCEKPVGLSSCEARRIADAATDAGITNAVGFTYIRSPLIRHARRLLDEGILGAPLHFRGHHCEDYLADKDAPFSWRLDAKLAGRSGALGDLGWHIISIARYLCGAVVDLSGSVRTFHASRKDRAGDGSYRPVENEDWAGMTVRFESGASGVLDTSRIAHGRKMDIGFELTCERGTIAFAGERSNEISLYLKGGRASEDGFKTININAGHPDYGAFNPAPGHGLGFNDLKTIELYEFLKAIDDGRSADPDLNEACKIARLCEAVAESSNKRIWIADPEGFEFADATSASGGKG